jgi:MoCo/4Fe-4S cofactor protein with predicted Tat translocation signal
MKRQFNHPPESKHGRRYWRSMEELAQTPGFKERLAREFPQGAAELEGDEISRRGFMKFMGASLALAGIGLTGCRRPELHMVPYSKGVEWQVPGNALHYATVMPRRGGAIPLVATSYNGRPTKLEGNPLVPGYNGTTDIFGQSAVLDLYDPDRSQAILKVNTDSDGNQQRGQDYFEQSADDFWKEFDELTKGLGGGEGSAILTEPGSSPSRERLRGEVLKKFPQLLWAEYEPWATDTAYSYDLSKADVIVSLDCDFLGASEGTVQTIAGFAAGRRKLGKTQETMSRLYVVEGKFSLTGGMADHRLRLPSSSIGAFANALASRVGTGGELPGTFSAFSEPNVDAWLTEVAKDLSNAKGRAIVLCGSQQPPEVQQLVMQMNDSLGAKGAIYQERFVPKQAAATIGDLATQMTSGAIKTLFVLGGNPAFSAPAELKFDELLAKVPTVIRLGLHVDETSALATTHLPAAHFLEYWGDALSYDTTTYLCQQPLILPLYNGISELDFLAALAGLPKAKGPEYVQETFSTLSRTPASAGQAYDDAWRKFVHDGYFSGDGLSFPIAGGLQGMLDWAARAKSGEVSPTAVKQVPGRPLQDGEYELVFTLGCIDDGRYANNGWLQELPEPVSKLTWDNALYMSPKTAAALDVKIAVSNNNLGDIPNTDVNPRETPLGLIPHVDMLTAFPMAEITLPDGRTMELPVLIAPGQADKTLSIALGYGRAAPRLTQADKDVVTPPLRVAEGAGFNVYPLRTSTTPGFIAGVKVKKIDKTYPLAITQEHNSMEGRGLVREAPLDIYHKTPTFVQDISIDKDVPQGMLTGYQNFESGYDNPPLNRLATANEPAYQPDRPAWGMVIDLNTCVGCNTCVVACQAENNIPIVGKFQVMRGREMHWIRLDRYFASDNPPQDPFDMDPKRTLGDYLDDPQMLIQPMACQQCENAPCEPVCPVNATVHNEEGLNVMAYNRCIGTRYCANNCPYKVRRFNFFNYNDRPIQNVKLPVLGVTNELFLGPFAGRDGPLTYKGSPESLMLQKNPNVTVRIRGVMEKCTYCIQRIEEAKIDQLRKSNDSYGGSDNIMIATDSFKSACQQVCPAEAITFGNLNDVNSKVYNLKKDERNYGVLAYLGTRPRTSYLGRVRNPNPAMPGAQFIGHTSIIDEEPADPSGASAEKPASGADNAAPVPANHVDAERLNLEKLIG